MDIIVDNIRIKTSAWNEISELEDLYGQAMGQLGFDRLQPPVSPRKFLRGVDAAAEHRENYELLSVYVTDMLVGYIALYRDFPAKQYARIIFIFIAEAARRQGFGEQTLAALCRYFYEAGYKTMRVTVSLRSWGALRFFYSLAFREITELAIDGELDSGGCGTVDLERKL